MRLFFPLTKGDRLCILLAVLFSVGEAVLELMLPQAMSDIVDVGIATGDRAYIFMMGVKMLVLAVLPVVIFYAVAQRHIIKGVLSGAVKG